MPAQTKRRILLILALSPVLIACAGLLFFFYGRFIELNRIQITRHAYTPANMTPELEGFTIVHMADFHRGPWMDAKSVRRAVRISNAQNPDLVVLTGDFAQKGPAYLDSCAHELANLHATYGVFATPGNHDHYTGIRQVRHALENAGITLLINKHAHIAHNLYLIGIDDYGRGWPDTDRAYRGLPPGAIEIVASHSPRLIHQIEHRHAFMLTSHTHGGQINIPFLPVHKHPRYKNFPWIAGWYRQGKADFYVNRGLGAVGPPMRFRARPEIAVFTLTLRPGS